MKYDIIMKMHTTDPQDEIFDIVDEKDKVIGQTTRREANRNTHLIHRSIFVVVFNRKGELFLQQRSATKDTEPLLWTISCSGHVLSGNTYEQTAQRELLEELGIEAPLIYIETFIVNYPNETEMTTLYKAYSNGPFRLHPEETLQGRFFSKADLQKAIREKKIQLAYSGICALEHIHWLL